MGFLKQLKELFTTVSTRASKIRIINRPMVREYVTIVFDEKLVISIFLLQTLKFLRYRQRMNIKKLTLIALFNGRMSYKKYDV